MMRVRRMNDEVRIWKDEGRMNNDESKEDEG
jgi:hypothetical protein